MIRAGACTFRQLPAAYQELFRNGANKVGQGVFVAEKHPASVLLGLPMLWLFSAIPAMYVQDGGLSFSGVRGLLSLIPPISMAGLTLVRLREAAELYRRHKAGLAIYGIVMDAENLVSREFRLLPVKSCVMIPRSQITALAFQKAVGHPSKYGTASSLWVQYCDEQGKSRSHKLAEGNSFALRPERLRYLLLAHNRRIQGEWRLGDPEYENSAESVLQFDEHAGRLKEIHDGKVFAESVFTFRETGYREITIDALDEASTSFRPVELGRYKFEIEVDPYRREKRYLLRFEREMGGNRGRWFGPVVDASWQSAGRSETEMNHGDTETRRR